MKSTRTFITTSLFAFGLCLACPGQSAQARPTARTEIKLAYGFTDVKLGALTVRIIKGTVGNGTASSFDTYTAYLMPEKPGEAWMQIITLADKGIVYNFRGVESGDATLQAIAFYSESNQLYAVQAKKIGAAVDARGSRKTPFKFEIFQYNGSEDVPMFDNDREFRSKGTYVDGTEAIQHELFGR